MATQFAQTGKGVVYRDAEGNNHSYEPYGHSFNPSYTADWVAHINENLQAVSVTSAIGNPDLTGFYPGTEVITCLTVVYGPSSGCSMTHNWKHPDGSIYFSFTYNFGVIGAGGWGFAFSYNGIKPPLPAFSEPGEIFSNATYSVDSIVTDGGGTQTISFTTSNLDTSLLTLHTGYDGSIWVEGNNICFISHMGTKHIIANDGEDWGYVGNPGAIWVNNVGGLSVLGYTDSNGHLRYTTTADLVGWGGYDGLPSSGHTPGYIWAQNNFNYTYLMFIDYLGNQARISQGYMFGSGQ